MALLSVADALARVLDGVDAAAARGRAAHRSRTDACWRTMSRRCAPSRRPISPPWTATRCAPPTSQAFRSTLRARRRGRGRPSVSRVGSAQGEAARIFTGGVVPPGADTIVIQENTKRDGDRVTVTTPSPPGRHIRRAGLDFRQGEVLLPRGRRLTDRDLMLAAAMNHPRLPVHRRPTGRHSRHRRRTEAARQPRSGPGEIVYSNGFALMALARAEGAEVIDLGIVPDRVDATIAAIRQRARQRRRHAADDGRRVGRRLRPRAEGARRRRASRCRSGESRCGPAGR